MVMFGRDSKHTVHIDLDKIDDLESLVERLEFAVGKLDEQIVRCETATAELKKQLNRAEAQHRSRLASGKW